MGVVSDNFGQKCMKFNLIRNSHDNEIFLAKREVQETLPNPSGSTPAFM